MPMPPQPPDKVQSLDMEAFYPDRIGEKPLKKEVEQKLEERTEELEYDHGGIKKGSEKDFKQEIKQEVKEGEQESRIEQIDKKIKEKAHTEGDELRNNAAGDKVHLLTKVYFGALCCYSVPNIPVDQTWDTPKEAWMDINGLFRDYGATDELYSTPKKKAKRDTPEVSEEEDKDESRKIIKEVGKYKSYKIQEGKSEETVELFKIPKHEATNERFKVLKEEDKDESYKIEKEELERSVELYRNSQEEAKIEFLKTTKQELDDEKDRKLTSIKMDGELEVI
ncbi:hypothetical protein N7454_003670 [Penicillium verhagenii]|nr:hypothetical protein N7454_003670 [Penicillium verhagenii]